MTSASTDLTGYAKQVAYELTELLSCAVWIVEWPHGTGADQTLKNALLEAELVHARCLLEFLLNRDNQKESIVAYHFAPTWTAPNEGVLKSDHKRICDHLSHLSKKRLAGKEVWDLVAIPGAVLDAMENLVQQLGVAPHEEVLRQRVRDARRSHVSIVQVCRPATSPLSAVVATTSSSTSELMILGSTGPPPKRRTYG